MRGFLAAHCLILGVFGCGETEKRGVAPPPTGKTLQEGMIGEWKVVKVIVAGKEKRPKEFEGAIVTFTENKMKGKDPGDDHFYRLDPKAKPATIDLAPESEKLPIILKGIIKLDEDLLTLCYQRDLKAPRPTEFVSPSDTEIFLTELQRIVK